MLRYNPLAQAASNIPEEYHQPVLEAVERNQNRIGWDSADLQYIFDIYNRFIAPKNEPERITCAGCRTKVIGKMRQFAWIWKDQQ